MPTNSIPTMPQVQTDAQRRVNSLRSRISNLKMHLPKKWMQEFILEFPQYDTIKGYSMLRSIYHLRSVSETVTDQLEKMFLNK
jgi:hypothetical protein